MISIIYANAQVIYSVHKFADSQVFVHVISPCDFEMISKGVAVKEGYILTNDKNDKCYCKKNFQ